MNFVTIFFLIIVWINHIDSYRITILTEGQDPCNDQKCNGRPHTSCFESKPAPNCKRFELMHLKRRDAKNILNGHNGLRNRQAKNTKQPASNMNYLHWNRDLQKMAERWIMQCTIAKDDCNFIHENSITVGQNIMFVPEYPSSTWTATIIRSWYLEGNSIDSSIIDRYVAESESNYTQLIWAKSEFVGCAAARMFGGYMMACNYHPTGNINGERVYYIGHPCSNCSADRSICSRVYKGLCGIDDWLANDCEKSINTNRLLIVIICWNILIVLINYI